MARVGCASHRISHRLAATTTIRRPASVSTWNRQLLTRSVHESGHRSALTPTSWRLAPIAGDSPGVASPRQLTGLAPSSDQAGRVAGRHPEVMEPKV